MEEMKPTKREEEFLRGIARAAAGEESSVPTPVWDYEKRLYDIWLAAKGEDPIYNLPVRTPHPDAFYAGILDALASGGGGSDWELLGEGEFDVSTTSTSEENVGTITLSKDIYTLEKNSVIFVSVADKAGLRGGRFYATRVFSELTSNHTSQITSFNGTMYTYSSGALGTLSKQSFSKRGVYPKSINRTTVTIAAKYYSSDTLTIDGTFVVKIYKLSLPDDIKIF